jgi:hypothetical protein
MSLRRCLLMYNFRVGDDPGNTEFLGSTASDPPVAKNPASVAVLSG